MTNQQNNAMEPITLNDELRELSKAVTQAKLNFNNLINGFNEALSSVKADVNNMEVLWWRVAAKEYGLDLKKFRYEFNPMQNTITLLGPITEGEETLNLASQIESILPKDTPPI